VHFYQNIAIEQVDSFYVVNVVIVKTNPSSTLVLCCLGISRVGNYVKATVGTLRDNKVIKVKHDNAHRNNYACVCVLSLNMTV